MSIKDLTGLPAGIERDSKQHVEWLMRERVEVIGKWPGMPKWYIIGETVLENDKYDIVTVLHIPWNGSFVEPFNLVYDFPHLFRRMSWWEGRSMEQMCSYVKYATGANIGAVQRVDKADSNTNTIWINNRQKSLRLSLSLRVPATAAEYEAFTNKQQ